MIAVIVNPFSGAGGRGDRGPQRAATARRLLAARGVEAQVRLSEHAGHAVDLARDALDAGAALVCAWGGDGTINEVARVLAHTGVPLGVIPDGSGNGFARELGLLVEPAQALDVALDGRDRVIDAGELGGRLFVNIAGVGLDARIAARFNAGGPRRRGVLRYAFLAARELATYRPARYRLITNQGQSDTQAFIVALGNLRQYGNGACIAPQAQPDDGQLDLVAAGTGSTLNAILLAPRLFTRTLHLARGVHTERVTEVTISSTGPLLCHVDGETFETGPQVVARVKPAALRIRVPRGGMRR